MSGVTVFWEQGPEPLSAGLLIGVGRRDEDFVRGGLTHLLEHLVMHELHRTSLDVNASVDSDVLQFTATGRPDRVAAFLRRACELLGDPPLERLGTEALVLRAEDDVSAGPGPMALALAERYGSRGLGLIGLSEPALLSLTEAHVREWARTYVVRGNAALWLTGPVPEGLELPLPDGAPPRRRQEQASQVFPAWTEHPCDEVVLAAEVDAGVAAQCALRLLRQRVEDELRHRRGLTYQVHLDDVRVDGERRHAAIVVQVRPEHRGDAVRTLHAAVRDLAERGPEPEEFRADREVVEEVLADPRMTQERVRAAAVAQVRGWPVRPEDHWPDAEAALTPDQVRESARQVRAALLLGVPEDVPVDLPGVRRLPAWSPDLVAGTAYRRRLLRGVPRGARLVVGADGVSLVLGREQRITVLWSEVLGLVDEGDGEHALLGARGWCVFLSPGDWRGGQRALDAVRAQVPTELQVRADPQPDPEEGPEAWRRSRGGRRASRRAST